MREIKSLGIMGGTFDPIHYGHLVMAECSRCTFNLDKVLVVPALWPPHKDRNTVLEGENRVCMVKMAIEDNPCLELSVLEMEREGHSYTIDTITYYNNRYPRADIYFIMGADALLLLNTWHKIDQLATMCNFIVATRPGYRLDHRDERLADLPGSLWDKLHFMGIPGIDISSSEIRRRIINDEPIRYLVPPAVEKYIIDHNLYREQ